MKATRVASCSPPPIVEAALASSGSIGRARRRNPRSEPPESSADAFAQRLAEIEARLASVDENPASGRELSDEALATVAQRIYRARLHRARHLPAALFGEPAWDILLDLFISLVRGKRVRTTSAVLAAGTPGSTGLRWLAALEAHGLVERHTEPADRRVRLIRLTPLGYQRMRAYLTEGVDAGELPAGRFLE